MQGLKEINRRVYKKFSIQFNSIQLNESINPLLCSLLLDANLFYKKKHTVLLPSVDGADYCAHELKNWDLFITRRHHHVGGSFLDGTTFIPTYKSVPSMLLQCLHVV